MKQGGNSLQSVAVKHLPAKRREKQDGKAVGRRDAV